MPHQSKSLVIFNSRRVDTEKQLQIVDAGVELMLHSIKSSNTPSASIAQILSLSPKQYPALKAKAKQPSAIFNRVRCNNYEFALRRIYTHFGEYCRNILRELYEKNPLLVVGKAPGSSLQYHEIVKLGDYDRIADYMVDQVFKHLESDRNTVKTIKKLIAGTSVTIADPVFDEALGFFEVRHLIVHQSGLVDRHFCDRYPDFLRVPTKAGSKLPLSIGFTMRGIKAVAALIESIDSQLLPNNLVA